MSVSIYEREYDVVVAGGGVSGSAAAVSAARSGASVLVLEQSGYLGGTLTGCGVGPMMSFHAGEKQVIRGFMQELVDQLVTRGYSPGHVPDAKQYTDTITPFDAEGLKLVLDDILTCAGCDILFHTFAGAVGREGDAVTGITVCNKDGLNTVRGKVYIDATGDGDIAAWAGAPMTKGRPEDGASQPMTMKMKFCNVDIKALKAYVLENIDDFPHMKPHAELFEQDIPLSLEGFDRQVAEAKAKGELSIARENILLFGTARNGECIINTTRIIGQDATDAASLSEAEIIGRKQCAELERFMHSHIPGFGNAILEFTGPSIGVRGSRQLSGLYTLTAEDIIERKRFGSVIAHSGYPIDIHNPKGEGTASTFMNERGTYYNIPYEIMICKELRNLMVVGRCVSASFEAQASIRVTPSAGAIGQAGGIAAANAANTGGDVRGINIKALQEALKKQGAYIEI